MTLNFQTTACRDSLACPFALALYSMWGPVSDSYIVKWLSNGFIRIFCIYPKYCGRLAWAKSIRGLVKEEYFVIILGWFLSHLLVAGCNIGVRFSVRPSVRLSVCLSTFMSTFDIYVKASILINYKTKQPSNLAWNISLTSWLCNIGVCFSVCLSIRPSVCQHLCWSSTFMSKLVF